MKVVLPSSIANTVEGTVIDQTRNHSLVKWDNGYTEWHDTSSLVPVPKNN